MRQHQDFQPAPEHTPDEACDHFYKGWVIFYAPEPSGLDWTCHHEDFDPELQPPDSFSLPCAATLDDAMEMIDRLEFLKRHHPHIH